MAGAMRKLGLYLGLVEDDEDARQYDDDSAVGSVRRYSADEGHRGSTATLRRVDDRTRRAEPGPTSRGSLAVDDAHRPRPRPDEPYRITTLHPRTYNEARQIGEHFREGTPVIMNLTEMDDGDAKRLVDFAAGLIFGLRGSIERVTAKVFLLSPQDVEVTAEDKARIVEGGFFNQS